MNKKIHRSKCQIWVRILLMMYWTILVVAFPIRIAWSASTDLEIAVLKEDWKKVQSILSSKKDLTPAERLVKGHALLATNQNNESLCQFLSAASESDRKAWKDWTQAFADTHSESAIAQYLKGDALARMKQWDAALLTFNRVLELQSEHALVLNARGVVYIALKRWDKALIDFTNASQKAKLADASANLGNLAIHKSEGAKGALTDFSQAIEISPDFAVALYGRGSVESVLGRFEGSRKDIESAIKKTNCLSGLIGASVAEVLARIDLQNSVQVADAEGNPGFQVERRIDAMRRNGTTGFGGVDLKNLISLRNTHTVLAPKIDQAISQLSRENPRLGANIQKDLNSIKNHNKIGMAFADVLEKMRINPGIQKGSLGMTGTIDFSQRAQSWKNNMNNNLSIIKSMQDSMPSGMNPSGFKTGLEEATWDEGDWPFSPLYGLSYEVISENNIQVMGGEGHK